MPYLLQNLKLKLAGLLLLFRVPGISQTATDGGPFENEISYYRHIDTIQQVPDNPILFVGSSSVKNWYGFDSTFRDMNCLNRGFGGSTIDDVIFYAGDVLLKYNPRQIVLYIGENDFAKSDSVIADSVYAKFQQLYSLIRTTFPATPVAYMSIKPSPAKYTRLHKIEAYNKMVADFIEQQPHTSFINIYSPMLDVDGKPDSIYFTEDLTHMNETGYALWNKIVFPYLLPPK